MPSTSDDLITRASALRPVDVGTWFPGFLARAAFFCGGEPDGFRAGVIGAIEGVRVHQGDPRRVLELDGVYLRPGELSLYDRDGRRILDSCIRRGPGLAEYYKPGPEQIVPPRACAVIHKPLLYLSWVQQHWGHFLTEGISRLWARFAHPELCALRSLSHFPYPSNEPVAGCLAALGISPEYLRHFKVPVRIDKCFIPAPSFSNRGEGFTSHIRVFREVLRAIPDPHRGSATAQPVFLSRTRLDSSRRVSGEGQLEAALAQRGVRIVHPQLLSLAEQMALFNRHRIFIGCWGSAFHGLGFAENPQDITTHVIVDGAPNTNYLMFDAILGCRSNYVQAIFPTPGADRESPQPNLSLDVAAIVAYLAGNGGL